MTRFLWFAKLRKRRGEIEAGKRLVGWPSTRSGGSVVQADRLARMDSGTLRVQPNVGGPSTERHPGLIHRKDALWRTGDLESVEGPLCLPDGQTRLVSVAKPGVRACGEHWQLHTARRPSGGKFATCLGIAHCLPEPAGVQGHHRLDVPDPGAKLPLTGVLGQLPGRDAVGPGRPDSR